ncbi:MAG TPA: DUF507 family protein [Thermoanaerobaculia bacterium]|jgi:hypothetical protein
MRPSRERLEHLARELVETLARSKSVILLKDREAVRQAVAQALAEEMRREEQREENARRRLAALRAPRPHTKEWDELFLKFIEEEAMRDGLDS